jgi:hypothetical protein
MELYISEYCKLTKIENGNAIGTFCVPVDLCDEVMSMASSILNGTRLLKMKSRGLAAASGQPIARFGVKNK